MDFFDPKNDFEGSKNLFFWNHIKCDALLRPKMPRYRFENSHSNAKTRFVEFMSLKLLLYWVKNFAIKFIQIQLNQTLLVTRPLKPVKLYYFKPNFDVNNQIISNLAFVYIFFVCMCMFHLFIQCTAKNDKIHTTFNTAAQHSAQHYIKFIAYLCIQISLCAFIKKKIKYNTQHHARVCISASLALSNAKHKHITCADSRQIHEKKQNSTKTHT